MNDSQRICSVSVSNIMIIIKSQTSVSTCFARIVSKHNYLLLLLNSETLTTFAATRKASHTTNEPELTSPHPVTAKSTMTSYAHVTSHMSDSQTQDSREADRHSSQHNSKFLQCSNLKTLKILTLFRIKKTFYCTNHYAIWRRLRLPHMCTHPSV